MSYPRDPYIDYHILPDIPLAARRCDCFDRETGAKCEDYEKCIAAALIGVPRPDRLCKRRGLESDFDYSALDKEDMNHVFES